MSPISCGTSTRASTGRRCERVPPPWVRAQGAAAQRHGCRWCRCLSAILSHPAAVAARSRCSAGGSPCSAVPQRRSGGVLAAAPRAPRQAFPAALLAFRRTAGIEDLPEPAPRAPRQGSPAIFSVPAAGVDDLPESVSEEMLEDEGFLKRFHHALLEVHLEEGSLVCPETGEALPRGPGKGAAFVSRPGTGCRARQGGPARVGTSAALSQHKTAARRRLGA